MDARLSSNQDKILYHIKRSGPQRAKALGRRLRLTTMAVRQHLTSLATQGLIEAIAAPLPRQRGRPAKAWKLTAAGHARFPDAHAQVTAELIAGVRQLLGEDALDRVIEERAARTLASYQSRLAADESLESKVRTLARLRSEEGYMAEVQAVTRGEYLLIEQHCPICIAASACQGFCRTELVIFRQVFRGLADVERVEYLLAGARRCSYRITACK